MRVYREHLPRLKRLDNTQIVILYTTYLFYTVTIKWIWLFDFNTLGGKCYLQQMANIWTNYITIGMRIYRLNEPAKKHNVCWNKPRWQYIPYEIHTDHVTCHTAIWGLNLWNVWTVVCVILSAKKITIKCSF